MYLIQDAILEEYLEFRQDFWGEKTLDDEVRILFKFAGEYDVVEPVKFVEHMMKTRFGVGVRGDILFKFYCSDVLKLRKGFSGNRYFAMMYRFISNYEEPEKSKILKDIVTHNSVFCMSSYGLKTLNRDFINNIIDIMDKKFTDYNKDFILEAVNYMVENNYGIISFYHGTASGVECNKEYFKEIISRKKLTFESSYTCVISLIESNNIMGG